jgi:hypothetical protein
MACIAAELCCLITCTAHQVQRRCTDVYIHIWQSDYAHCVAGVIVFDFSGVKDNGQIMKSDETRDKMQLMAQPMATFHKELKLGDPSLSSVCVSYAT